MEPVSSSSEETLALDGSRAADEMIVSSLLRDQDLPAVGAARGAAPFSTERQVEPLFEDATDTLFLEPSKGGQGVTTGVTGPAASQPGAGVTIGVTGPAAGQPGAGVTTGATGPAASQP